MNNPTLARTARALLVILPVFVWTACGAPPPPPKRPAPPPPAPKVLDDDDKPKTPTAIYVYSPVGKRDPFQNVFAIKEVKQTAVRPSGDRKAGPLQRFSLDRLRLSLTMTGTSSPLAMIEDPDGRGWTVHIGDFVGQNWGKVTSIQRDQIIITETITDNATGRVYLQNYPLKVPKSADELMSEQMLKDGESLGAAQR
ncbi:MAG: pilus assembly protein PilP [Deltaproteobacteria bacterium]|nr:pilus assembly protein PilP [Deltaproteobacteria bacterium]